MKKAFLITFFSVILLGCTSQKKVLNTWLGSTKQNLIYSWGPPVRIADDGNGGQVLIYAHQVYIPEWKMNYWDYKMMYINTNGKIYHWRTSREQVAPTEVNISFIN